MAGAALQLDDDGAGEPVAVLSRERAGREDGHWERAHRREPYYKPGLDYEDYAPAYCVGYIGHAQYGGRFEDAERSLCANWERIKGDSRLSLDDALMAMRAAWDRMDGQPVALPGRPSWIVGMLRRRLAMSSFKLSAKLLR
jgi:hypothetical protein